MDSWGTISGQILQDLDTFRSALQADSRHASGFRDSATNLLALDRLEASLRALQLSLDSNCASFEFQDGCLLALPSPGPTTARYMLTENPALSQGVLEFVARTLRWSADVPWPPLEPSQGSQPISVLEQNGSGSVVSVAPAEADSPQLSPSTARGTLARTCTRALDILRGLLELGPMEPACRLGCALLRMHTLQACSRGLARAVEHHTQYHNYTPPAATPDAVSEPNMRPPPTAVTPQPSESDGTQAAPGAATAAFGEVFHTVECGTVLLQCCFHVLSRLEIPDQPGGGDGHDAGAVPSGPPDAGGARSTTSHGAESSSSSSSSSSDSDDGGGSRDDSSNGHVGCAGDDRGSRTGAVGSGGSSGRLAGPPSAAVVGLLREALLGSSLVEHVARGVLYLLLAGRSDGADVVDQLRAFVDVYEALGYQLNPTYGRGMLSDTCTAVLGGPCAAYAAAAAGLQVLCTADGGPSYGMHGLVTDYEMRDCWLQAAGGAGGEGEGAAQQTRLGAGRVCLDDSPLKALLHALASRPPKRRSVTSIMLRLGYLAVALGQRGEMLSGEAGAGGSGDRGGANQHGMSLLISDVGVSMQHPHQLAMLALRGYWLQCAQMRGARRLEAEVEGWRLACAVTRELLVAAATEADTVEEVAYHLGLQLRALPEKGPLPEEPPASLAAALSGGLLPCLERFFRMAAIAASATGTTGDVPSSSAATTDPRAAAVQLLVCILTHKKSRPFLEVLLAYGSPTEVAALIASVCKLLRSVVGQLLPTDGGGERQPYALLAELATSAASLALDLAFRWMWGRTWLEPDAEAAAADVASGAAAAEGAAAGVAAGAAAAAGAGTGAGTGAAAGAAAGATAAEGAVAGVGGVAEEGQGPERQLRRMAVLAACEWLPALFGVVTEAARRVLLAGALQQQVPELQAGSPLLHLVRLCTYVCMLWLPMTAAYEEEPGRTAGLSTSSQAGPGEAVQLAAVGQLGRWRLRRLAQEAPPVQLLGAGMVLESYLAASGAVSAAAGGQAWKTFVTVNVQLLTSSCVLAVTSPAEVRRALACGAAPGYPVHCMWSSGTVRQLLRALPPGVPCYADAQVLADLLAAWEGGAAHVSITNPAYCLPAGRTAVGSGFLEALVLELDQPSPLRRCSWWRCANLAGDSEAGLPLQACARCGGAWYCGRACQVAHWRAGHKAECGVGSGGQGEGRGPAGG